MAVSFLSSLLPWYLRSSAQLLSVQATRPSPTVLGCICGARLRLPLVSNPHTERFSRLITLTSAIIVACLATFRNLFSRESSRRKVEKAAKPASSNLFLRGTGSRKKIRDILDSLASVPDHDQWGYQQQSETTNDARSIIDHQSHGDHYNHSAHDLDDYPRAV